MFWMQSAVVPAIEHGLTVEEADAIIGKPLGIPKTGVFGLLDLVGLDLMPHINASMARRCRRRPTPSTAVNRDAAAGRAR